MGQSSYYSSILYYETAPTTPLLNEIRETSPLPSSRRKIVRSVGPRSLHLSTSGGDNASADCVTSHSPEKLTHPHEHYGRIPLNDHQLDKWLTTTRLLFREPDHVGYSSRKETTRGSNAAPPTLKPFPFLRNQQMIKAPPQHRNRIGSPVTENPISSSLFHQGPLSSS